ncbi:MAG: Gfo/Idh/MocA family oxidoreductase [Deltaproteobacteria bacterium]|nr:Gfo/Idh/MocA family oxidoreductase [Deltaproteobacteria bacterium]
MSDKKLRVGVVGVGHLGRFHVQKYADMPDVDLVGVVDINQKQAQEIANQYHARVFAIAEELYPQVDAVSVVVPTVDHYQVACQALNSGIHVLLEKPIAATVAEAEELVRLAESKQCILQIGHLERFNPAFVAGLEITRQPRFLEVHRLSPFTFRSVDVDVVLDLMIHDLDLVLCLVKSPISEIFAVGVPVLSDQVDIANVRIHFANGAVCNLTASRVSIQKERKIRLFQPDVYISMDLANSSLVQCEKKELDYYSPIPDISVRKYEYPEADSLKLEIESFTRSVRAQSKPVVSGADGLAALKVAFRIKEIIAAVRQQ